MQQPGERTTPGQIKTPRNWRFRDLTPDPPPSPLQDKYKFEYDAEGYVCDQLHLDAPERPGMRYEASNGFVDPGGRLDMRDLPCPSVNVNFLPRDFTRLNGPTRFVPAAGSSVPHEFSRLVPCRP